MTKQPSVHFLALPTPKWNLTPLSDTVPPTPGCFHDDPGRLNGYEPSGTLLPEPSVKLASSPGVTKKPVAPSSFLQDI